MGRGFGRVDAWVQCSFLVLEAGLELPHPRHPTWSVGLSFSLVSVQTIHTPPDPAGRFCLLLGLRVCRRKFLMLGTFCNGSLRTLISWIFDYVNITALVFISE
jgi:hypothetical protein